MANVFASHYFNGLKSKTEKTRNKAATELLRYATTELRELSTIDDLVAFMDACNTNIFNMVSSSDINEKKGGILAIGMNLLNLNKNISILFVKSMIFF